MDWVALDSKESLEDTPVKYLYKRNGFVDTLEVDGGVHLAAEVLPLFPSGGVLLANQERKILGGCLSCSIEGSFCLNLERRVSSHQRNV